MCEVRTRLSWVALSGLLIAAAVTEAQAPVAWRDRGWMLFGPGLGYGGLRLAASSGDVPIDLRLSGLEVSLNLAQFWPSSERVGLGMNQFFGLPGAGGIKQGSLEYAARDANVAMYFTWHAGPTFDLAARESVLLLLSPSIGLSSAITLKHSATRFGPVVVNAIHQVVAMSFDVGVNVTVAWRLVGRAHLTVGIHAGLPAVMWAFHRIYVRDFVIARQSVTSPLPGSMLRAFVGVAWRVRFPPSPVFTDAPR